jgi:hypothetical protein
VFIDLDNINVDFLVERMVIVEKDPLKIWNSVEKYYGMGYFKQEIEN